MKCKCSLPTMAPTLYLENISYYVKYPWTTITRWEVQNDNYRGLPNPSKWVYIKEETVLVSFLWYASVLGGLYIHTKLKIFSTMFSRTTNNTLEFKIQFHVLWLDKSSKLVLPLSFIQLEISTNDLKDFKTKQFTAAISCKFKS